MTYNVRSCRGQGNRYSSSLIARIVSRLTPDVVALQEVDDRLSRSGFRDQARSIAGHLGMRHCFHPSLSEGGGGYGNAVLSRLPMEVVKAGQLMQKPGRKVRERRGALWVRIGTAAPLQLINTHLSLNRSERLLQARELVGPRWLGSAECAPPVVLCGDFNASTRSPVCRVIGERLKDARQGRPGATWPSGHPFRRIDHIFISPDVTVEESMVPRGGEVRRASDHLPVLARVKLSA
jgi:endonuclease/exonuclease/phosphatase family metal-dependent hydrolase